MSIERYLKLGEKYLSEGLELLSRGDLAQAVKTPADESGPETHRH